MAQLVNEHQEPDAKHGGRYLKISNIKTENIQHFNLFNPLNPSTTEALAALSLSNISSSAGFLKGLCAFMARSISFGISVNETAPSRKRRTDSSLAAFITAGMVPPIEDAASASSRHLNFLKSGLPNSSFATLNRSRGLTSEGLLSG